ncbi:MAG: RNA methyltransferase [Bacteroidota bacterium]|nr:RNA methyltransferase [Bacteroidota bacterium]
MLSKKIIKYIQSLSHKKLRDEHAAFIAEGPKVVAELLLAKTFTCKIICAEQEWLSANKNLLDNDGVDIHEIDEGLLHKISALKTPNKVVAVFNKKEQNKQPQFSNKITLILDDINDPGNMGTIIRIADWFGIENIICSEGCVDCYNPKVVQSTMGSLARVNVLYTDLLSFITMHKNIIVYAAALSGSDLTEYKTLQEGFILIGNESRGIREELLAVSETQITIPRYGKAESLNAAVATGIILSHLIFGAHAKDGKA